jgi:signal transduction histidine kinase
MADGKGPEVRGKTDESLLVERRKTDVELARGREAIESSADAGVDDERDRADDAVRASRATFDELAEAQDEPERARLSAERAREDRILAAERDLSDRQRDVERSEHLRVLASLLAEEREETDVSLVNERRHSDDAIQAREDFLAMVSHDLRSLLGAISLNAGMIAGSHADELVIRRGKAIERLTVRMTRLVGDLIDVAGIDAGRFRVAIGDHDAYRLVRDTREAFEVVAAERGLTISTAVPAESLVVPCDAGRILQVLGNLVSNAIKFTPPGGSISIAARADGEAAIFSVTDTGRGIASGDVSAIFDRFWQTSTSANVGLGVGLGLYISKCIIDAHGGRIWVDTQLGSGSTFSFTLPRTRRGGG